MLVSEFLGAERAPVTFETEGKKRRLTVGRAIKGEIKEPGSNFDYAVPLTEVVLLGAMAQRTGKTIEWDAENMSVKGQPELASLIKEPTRGGWSYGEGLWRA